MSKFVIFKNANPPYEGTPIILNTDAIVSIYEDLTHAEKKVMIWSKDNCWHVDDSLDEVAHKLGLQAKDLVQKKEIN